MANHPLQIKVRAQAFRLVSWQLAGICLLAFLALLINGTTTACSVFAGGMAYGLANLLFAWAVFRFSAATEMVQFVIAFFVGEMLKLILSAVLFLMIVKYLPVGLLSVLVGFIGAIVMFWVACICQFSRQK